jgi:hypothetical protein
MNRPNPLPMRCRVCRTRVTDPAEHEDCLQRGDPWTGRLYRDEPPEPPEPRY